MTEHSTASQDAVRQSVCWDTEDTVFWLQPQGAAQPEPADNGQGRQLFLKVTASLSLGALLTFGTGGTALAPAAHAADGAAAPGKAQPVLVLPPKRDPQIAASQGMISIELPPEIGSPIIVAAADVGLPEIEPVEVAPIAFPTAGFTADSAAETTASVAALPSAPRESSEAASEVVDIDLHANRDPNELLQFGDMQVPRWIVETILRASEVTGVDPVYMMALADKESSFLPDSKARTSSAEGLFQFLSNTWLEVVQKFGAKHGLEAEAEAIRSVDGQLTVADESMREHILDLRRDPYLSALMAAEMKKRNRQLIERRLGRTISRSEFYLAHFFGVNSASKFMSLLDDKPKQSAPRQFPAAARANKSLFYAKSGRKTRHLTVSEVFSKIDAMIDKRLDRYEDVEVIATAAAMADASL